MFTVAFNIVRKGITELWTVTDTWTEAMRQIHNAGAVEIVSWERA
jgi:hypothetical protein